mgnify:CR=1 FL=1
MLLLRSLFMKNRVQTVTSLILAAAFILTASSQAFAQTLDWDVIAPGCIQNNIATLTCIPAVFQNIVFAALAFAGAVAVFFVIYAGIRYITSRGDPKAVEGAKNTLTWAIIGLVVIVLSFLIIQFIAAFTGASCITLFGFSNCGP